MHARKSTAFTAPIAAVAALALIGCGSASETDSGASASETVTIVTHDSFPSEEFEQAASKATGYNVKAITGGDGGELTNKLVLSQGAPIADVFYGVDTFFASRIASEDIVAPYEPKELPESAQDYSYDGSGFLTPIDQGSVCVNIDPQWFADNGIDEPTSYEDLADEKYTGLSVLLDPSSSSTGMAFFAGTIAHFGEDGFGDYWADLVANDARIENGWTEAYNGQFTQGGGSGTYPIVASYNSSPAWTLTEDGSSTTTKALLDTCTTQVEYAGILNGTENLEGAQAVVDFMVSQDFQDTIAGTMYMDPVDEDAEVPEEWAKFVEQPAERNDLPADEVGNKRDTWLKEWTQKVGD
ncbi:MAG: thiamine ABC transporter substrate-binding protein [Canibacter sp.]